MNNETNTSSDQGNRISMKPIEKKSLYLKISDSIYRYIQMNNLQPGDKLPSERDMSSRQAEIQYVKLCVYWKTAD